MQIKPRKEFIKLRDEHRRQRQAEREATRAAGMRSVGNVTDVVVNEEIQKLVDGVMDISLVYDPNESIIQVPEQAWKKALFPKPALPEGASGHDFSKFVSGFFQQGSSWAFSKVPLTKTLLKPKPGVDEGDALSLFNAILRFMGDPAVSGVLEELYGNYIISRGIYNEGLRDELYCMLCNQTWLNPNDVSA